MKGPETSRSLPKKDLFYLYEVPRDIHEPLNKEFCSTYMKGPETPRSLTWRNLCYLYEGPRDFHDPLNKQFVLPV